MSDDETLDDFELEDEDYLSTELDHFYSEEKQMMQVTVSTSTMVIKLQYLLLLNIYSAKSDKNIQILQNVFPMT